MRQCHSERLQIRRQVRKAKYGTEPYLRSAVWLPIVSGSKQRTCAGRRSTYSSRWCGARAWLRGGRCRRRAPVPASDRDGWRPDPRVTDQEYVGGIRRRSPSCSENCSRPRSSWAPIASRLVMERHSSSSKARRFQASRRCNSRHYSHRNVGTSEQVEPLEVGCAMC